MLTWPLDIIHFASLLERFTSLGPAYRLMMLRAELRESSWVFVLILLAAHVILFLVTALFFYYHIKRLNRPRWLPDMPWAPCSTPSA